MLLHHNLHYRVQLEPVDSSSPFSTGGFVSPASQSDVCQASYDCVENGELPSDYSMDDNTGALNLPKVVFAFNNCEPFVISLIYM